MLDFAVGNELRVAENPACAFLQRPFSLLYATNNTIFVHFALLLHWPMRAALGQQHTITAPGLAAARKSGHSQRGACDRGTMERRVQAR